MDETRSTETGEQSKAVDPEHSDLTGTPDAPVTQPDEADEADDDTRTD
jgi:hypothetical protein